MPNTLRCLIGTFAFLGVSCPPVWGQDDQRQVYESTRRSDDGARVVGDDSETGETGQVGGIAPPTIDPTSSLDRLLSQLSSERFGKRQVAASRLVEEGAFAIESVEASATSGDLDHAFRCVQILTEIAADAETRESALAALDRLGSMESFPGSAMARSRAFEIRETKQERAIRLLVASGVRIFRSRTDNHVRSVSGVSRNRQCVHLRHLPELTSVSLFGPGITNACLPDLAAVPRLSSLTIMRCSVTDRGMSELPKMKQLSRVSLSGDFSAAGLRHLRAVPNLRSVAIFSSIGAHELHILSQLTVSSLYLGELVIDEDAALILGEIKDVRSLSVSIEGITDDQLAWVKQCKVNSLNLTIEDSPKLTDEGVRHLKSSALSSLRLRDTGLTPGALPEIGKITSLTSLSIDGMPMADEHLQTLTKLTRLRTLTLRETKVTDKAMLKLKASMPSLRYLRNDLGVPAAKQPAKPKGG